MFGKTLKNPIGLAAGYDKNAEVVDEMFQLGFGYVEVGSITPQPQSGNLRPRFFRLSEDEAVINRYGFNSQGHSTVLERLEKRLRNYSRFSPIIENYSLQNNAILGINLGKNKTSPSDSHQDYLDGIETLGSYADVIVINISSPNTPGLRNLQQKDPIQDLLTLAKSKRDQCCKEKALVVKISPDCSEQELKDIASVVEKVGVDGVIISNTTISRPNLKSGTLIN